MEAPRKLLSVPASQATKELEWSILSLFRIIDYDEEGFINRTKVEEAFAHWGMPPEYAAQLTASCDTDGDGLVRFPEFLSFFAQKEQKLRALFEELYVGGEGAVTVAELGAALRRAGLKVAATELRDFAVRLDRDRNGVLSYDEWRDFLLLCPTVAQDLPAVYDFYSRAILVDTADQAVVPPGMGQRQAWKYFLAGAVAGATSRTGTAPLDRLKVLLQVQAGPVKHATGVSDGLRAIYLDGGLRAFWRGNGVNILKIAPESAVKFYTYERTKQLVCQDPRNMKVYHRLVAGGAAGLASQFAIYPMELLKTRLITQAVPRGLVATFRDIWYKEGPLTFYRGLGAALIGIVPYAAIDLTVFETLKVSYMQSFNVDAPSALAMLVCGTISSTIGSTTVYPLSLIRTRLQAQGATPDAESYTGMRDVIQRTMQREGLRGFYKGMYPNLLKVVPAVSISYVVYEKMKAQLEIR